MRSRKRERGKMEETFFTRVWKKKKRSRKKKEIKKEGDQEKERDRDKKGQK